jgi:hypothetical protein
MKKEVWILLGILLVVLLFSMFVRERFDPLTEIPKPPYTDAEKERIFGFLKTTEQDAYTTKAKASETDATKQKKKAVDLAATDFTPVFQSFFDTTYTPAKTITDLDVQKFLSQHPPATTNIDFQGLLTAYFVNQYKNHGGAGTSSQSVTTPEGKQLSYADLLKDVGETAGYSSAPAPVNTQPPADTQTSTTQPPADTQPPPPGVGGSQAVTSGTTTGGSTTSSLGPNNLLPSTGGLGVFGPVFTGLGTSSTTGTNGDSSKTSKYPQLLGGGDRKPSTRIEGVGIVPPSSSSTTDMLPSPSQTGSDPNSQYLPYSRTPGDQDMIPDPYRVSKTFQQSSYSYKPEPTPFLTDFSAFQK